MGVLTRALIAVAGLAVLEGSAAATALELYGYGPRASAMGLTGAASVDGTPALYYNPAGLASIDGIRVHIGYQVAPTRLKINGQSIGARQPRSTELGVGFGLQTFKRKSGLAIGLHVPDYGLYGVRLRPIDAPNFVVVDARRDRIHAMVGFALAATDWLEVGVGATMLSDTLAKMGIEYGVTQGADMDAQLLPTNTFHAGARGSFGKLGPFERVRVGLSYREEDISILSFPTTLHASVAGVDGDVNIRSRTYNFFTPHEVTLGLSLERPNLTVATDLIWSKWSAMYDPSGEGGILIVDRVGNFPPPPPAYQREDPNFHDTVSPHLGVEWSSGGTRKLKVRGGYVFVPTPAPAPSATRNLIDNDRHILTAGIGVFLPSPRVLSGPLELDLHATYSRLRDRTVVRNDPTDPVGSYKAGGELLSAGISATLHFDAGYLRD